MSYFIRGVSLDIFPFKSTKEKKKKNPTNKLSTQMLKEQEISNTISTGYFNQITLHI